MTETYSTFEQLPDVETVATIGTFDGVHRGHQHLLGRVLDRARERNAKTLVITFEPSPAQFFRPQAFAGRLTSAAQKIAILQEVGIDFVLVLPFTQDLANTSATAFMTRLSECGHVREMWIGADFALGHHREGNAPRLREIGAGLGIDVNVIDRVDIDGESISSSEIRGLILSGDVERANRLLGHRFTIRGPVVHGSKVGRTIGFPTANVPLPEQEVLPLDGIYASYARLGDDPTPLEAMTYIGTRPALNTGERLIETHLLDFAGDLYGQDLATEFVSRIRPDADFPSVDALVEQLKADEVAARRVFSSLQHQVNTQAATTSGV